MDEEKVKDIENGLNALIAEATVHGGHVYVVDKHRNSFALKLTEPVRIHFYGGYREDTRE